MYQPKKKSTKQSGQHDYYDMPESQFKISNIGSSDVSPMSYLPDERQDDKIDIVPFKNLSDFDGKYSGEKNESQLASSSGGVHSVNSLQLAKLAVMSHSQLKEIRAFTANELFKVRKQTNQLYKEFEQIKSMRNDVRQLMMEAQIACDNDRIQTKSKAVEKDLDAQFSTIRLQMRYVQVRHE